jgi:hypothetical protein
MYVTPHEGSKHAFVQVGAALDTIAAQEGYTKKSVQGINRSQTFSIRFQK